MKHNQQFLADVLCTALEGGIGYWSECGMLKSDALGYVSATLYPAEDDDFPETVLTRESIQQGIEKVLSPDFRVNPQIRAAIASGDAGQIDADAADVIVQAACFGEIVYG